MDYIDFTYIILYNTPHYGLVLEIDKHYYVCLDVKSAEVYYWEKFKITSLVVPTIRVEFYTYMSRVK